MLAPLQTARLAGWAVQDITRSLSPHKRPHAAPSSCPLLSELQMDLTMSRCIQGAGAGSRGRAEEQQAQSLLGTSEPRHIPLPSPAGTFSWETSVSKQAVGPCLPPAAHRAVSPSPAASHPTRDRTSLTKAQEKEKATAAAIPLLGTTQLSKERLIPEMLLDSFTPRLHLFVFIYQHLRVLCPAEEIPAIWA